MRFGRLVQHHFTLGAFTQPRLNARMRLPNVYIVVKKSPTVLQIVFDRFTLTTLPVLRRPSPRSGVDTQWLPTPTAAHTRDSLARGSAALLVS